MTVFGVCEKGSYREENQDSILMRHSGTSGLCVVADGVGGSEQGSRASRYITQVCGQWWDEVFLKERQGEFFVLFDCVKAAVDQMNKDICGRYGVGKCCSTIVLLFIHKGIYGFLSAGDSRIYRCGRNGGRLITRDDVWENRPDADACSRHAGKIISAIGGFRHLEYSCATDRVHLGDVFMLCSDGIYRYVEEPFLMDKLQGIQRCPFFYKRLAETLVQRAVENDTMDNYSLILLKV